MLLFGALWACRSAIPCLLSLARHHTGYQTVVRGPTVVPFCLPIGRALNSSNSSLQHGTVLKLTVWSKFWMANRNELYCWSPAPLSSYPLFLLAGLWTAITPVCNMVLSQNRVCGVIRPIGTSWTAEAPPSCLPIGWASNSHNSTLQQGTVSKFGVWT